MLSALLSGPILSLALLAPVVTPRPAAWQDPSPHRVRLVAVDSDVQLRWSFVFPRSGTVLRTMPVGE